MNPLSRFVQQSRLEHEYRDLQRQLDKSIEMILSAKSLEVAEACESKAQGLWFKTAEISEQIARLDILVRPFDEMLEHSMRYLANPCAHRKCAEPRIRECCWGSYSKGLCD